MFHKKCTELQIVNYYFINTFNHDIENCIRRKKKNAIIRFLSRRSIIKVEKRVLQLESDFWIVMSLVRIMVIHFVARVIVSR